MTWNLMSVMMKEVHSMDGNIRKNNEKNGEDFFSEEFSFNKKGVFFISFVLLVIIILFFSNTLYMKSKLVKETRQYVEDVSTHAVSNVSYILKENSLCIEEMADSFSRMPDFLLTREVLERKAVTWNLDGLAVITSKGMASSSDVFCELFYEWVDTHPEMYEKTFISYILNHKIIFSAPIRKDEKTVLVGVKNYDTMQELLGNTDFQDRGESLIVNSEGMIIFEPEEKQRSIYDIYVKRGEKGEKYLNSTITKKIQDGYQGIFEMEDEENAQTLISVQSLNINDWILLTIVPQDILSKTSLQPIIYFILIILFSTFVFLIILKYISKSQKKMIQQLKKFAFVDSVTEGFNGLAFRLEGERLIEKSRSEYYAIVFLNILNFRQVNERWGITEGNKVLKYIYQTIEETIAADECVARSEIDHYFLLIHNQPEKDLIERITKLINKVNFFGENSEIEDKYFKFDFSIGIYVVEDIKEEIRLCQGKARRAAGFGKGSNMCMFYDNKLVKRDLYNRHLCEIFENSLEKQYFEIYLQPKVYLNCDKNPSAEALIRWNHPEEGMIYPSDFIPLFEKNGMICRLDFYVFEQVCKLLQKRQQEHKTVFPVSVNFSRIHLKEENMAFVEKIVFLKEKYQIPDGILEIEMTESIMIEDAQLPLIKEQLDAFHKHGIICSLDDFGFGFSSLGILKSLDVDVIKLDRKFFMEENEKTWFIVSNFITLAHGLGIKTVAEGIETKEQVEILKKADCDMIQGYFYGKPMAIPDFVLWYEANRGEDL